MCLACEQDAMWFAYLQRRGLITSDGYLVEQPPFVAGTVELPPTLEEQAKESTPDSVDENKFSRDDPSASAAELKFIQASRKSE